MASTSNADLDVDELIADTKRMLKEWKDQRASRSGQNMTSGPMLNLLSNPPSVVENGLAVGPYSIPLDDLLELKEGYMESVFAEKCSTCWNLQPRGHINSQVTKVREHLTEISTTLELRDFHGVAASAKSGCQFCALILRVRRRLLGTREYKLTAITLTEDEPALLTFMRHADRQQCGIELFRTSTLPVPVLPTLGRASDVSDSSDSEACTRLMRGWLADCRRDHRTCIVLSPGLPTRLLDLGDASLEASTSDRVPSVVRLWEPTQIYMADGKYFGTLETEDYAALSYCWGKHVNVTTTTRNIEEMKRGIAVEGLPQVFKDAFTVCRRLKIRYLWIDSLCIIQDGDNRADWEVEAPKMANYYSNALVTIAAVSSAASNEPFLGPRPELTIPQSFRLRKQHDRRQKRQNLIDSRQREGQNKIRGGLRAQERGSTDYKLSALGHHAEDSKDLSEEDDTSDSDSTSDDFELSDEASTAPNTIQARLTLRTAHGPRSNSASTVLLETSNSLITGPLSRRGWTLQERFLSTRIIHFTEEGLRWECRAAALSEDGRACPPGVLETWHASWCSSSDDDPGQRWQLHRLWRRFVVEYSKRRLSQRRDLLVALSGLASRMHEMHGAAYAAGLWQDRLVEDLCWEVRVQPGQLDAGTLPLDNDDDVEDGGDDDDILLQQQPTWSWISASAHIDFAVVDEPGTFTAYTSVVSCTTTLQKPSGSPFGGISSGRLVLRSPVLPAELTYTVSRDPTRPKLPSAMLSCGSIQEPLALDAVLARDSYTTPEGGTETTVRRARRGEWPRWLRCRVYAVYLGAWRSQPQAGPGLVAAAVPLNLVMVVAPSARESGAFERIGLLKSVYFEGLAHWGHAEVKEVVVI